MSGSIKGNSFFNFSNFAFSDKTKVSKETPVLESTSSVKIPADTLTHKAPTKDSKIATVAVSFSLEDKLPTNLKNIYKNITTSLDAVEQKALEGLLKVNKLTLKDSTGKTVLENLDEIKTGKKQKGVDSKQLLKDSVLVLSDKKYITQGPHGTCGAGSLENHLWEKKPAELVRIVKDLAKSGECKLGDGSVLKAGTNSLDFHESDRRDFNIIFQSAVMKDVALVGGDRAIGNKYLYDLADYNVNNDEGDAKSVKSGDSAANPTLLKSLVESITSNKYTVKTSFIWGGDSRIEDLKKAVSQNKQPIALFSQEGYFGLHYVVIQKIDNDKVYFQNTATGKDEGSVDSMSIEDFKKKIRGLITPN